MAVKEYDLIVVGAGTAGIIAAARIAEAGINPTTGDKLRIGLIDAGAQLFEGERRAGYGHPNRRRLMPQISWEEFEMIDSFSWGFGPKMVGGSSVWWGGHAVLPVDLDYENWSSEMGIDWTRENMKEAVDDVVEMYHFHAAPEEAWSKGDKLFRSAAIDMGYDAKGMPSPRKNCIFCGFIGSGHGCKYDAKGTSLWYLPIAEANGVELIDKAEVEQVIIEKRGAGGFVKGVYYRKDGQIQEARAEKIVMSCGYAGTPVVLAKSGYGPRDELGSKLIVENNNVGRNLDGDTTYRIGVVFDEAIKEAGRGTTGSMYFLDEDPDYQDGSGVLKIWSTDLDKITYPHTAALSEFAPAFGHAHMDFMRTAISRLGTIGVSVNRPPTHIKGRLNLQTGARTYPGDPYIDRRMNEAREIALELAKRIGSQEISPRFPATFRGRGGGHTNGTCRAGSDRRNSVINQNFESHEVEGLFVVDAGSYPRAGIYSGFYAALMGAFGARRIVANNFSRGA
ncbi:MAG: GMC family oxidoreductase N-terminal domain-containing protein [Acidobacteria bacterium]|nr:GMC family oxidoreductase N-terminal domain-containing protein [Acidobacteriota bacterium]MCZ6879321.1 GMC family oxidoreductase N-terminal domain-containing protein [Acidobacteriota bacterium]